MKHPSGSMQIPGYLVEVVTRDGLRLKGFRQTHRESTETSGRLWILVHGVSGNFYDSSLLGVLAEEIFARGEDVLRINTRGHDPMAYVSTNGGVTRVGAAFEMIEDSRLDLTAWSDWSRRNGYRYVGFLGHSLGAVKVALSVSDKSDVDVDRVICLSPPRLRAEVLAADENYGHVYQEQLKEAEALISAGKPERLMYIRFPQPMHISAATFMDKYAGNRHDYMATAKKIGCKSLWVFGQLEVDGKRSNFRGCDKQLEEILVGFTRHCVVTIPGADHNYTQNRAGLWQAIKNWMDDQESSI